MPSDVQLQLLTHYALGELPSERLPEVERLLIDDPAARAWVLHVRRSADDLARALADGGPAGLDPARRAAIAARARPRLRLRPWAAIGGALAAAGIAGALLLPGRPSPPVPDAVLVHTGPAAAPQRAMESPPQAAIELPPAPENVADRPIAAVDLPVTIACTEEEPVRGRDEAVADADLGGRGSFMAIGSESGSGTRGGSQQVFLGIGYAGSPQPPVLAMPGGAGSESYAPIAESGFQDPARAPLSTFGLDIDTASYANVRRHIAEGRLPPADAVRIEEMLNAFRYADAPRGTADRPLAAAAEISACPWAPQHRLARISVGSQAAGPRPPCNLVFLVDVSGSMDQPAKLPLVRRSLHLLAERMRSQDRIAIVTYANGTRLALPSTAGDESVPIRRAIDALSAGGGTNGQAGIQLAYRIARENAVVGVNRVILCTDGDFNVGIDTPDGLRAFITEQRRTGVTLTVLGYGMGNLKDANLQALANAGNGSYAYIDSVAEARLNLVDRLDRHLVLAAKDAKVQVEFNPARIAAWRLIGWERRRLAAQDFANDAVDSGDIGVDADVIALYELVPRGDGGALRYQPAPGGDEAMFVQLRWKRPDRDASELLTLPVRDDTGPGSSDQRFAAAVAAFGMALRQSPDRGTASLELALQLARDAQGVDGNGPRRDFISLVRQAQTLR